MNFEISVAPARLPATMKPSRRVYSRFYFAKPGVVDVYCKAANSVPAAIPLAHISFHCKNKYLALYYVYAFECNVLCTSCALNMAYV